MQKKFLLITFFPLFCFSQIDTLIIKPKNLRANDTEKNIDSLYAAFTTKWVKKYDKAGHIEFEGLMYSDSPVGEYIQYYSNGKIRAKGFYKAIASTKKESKKSKSRLIGDWNEYNINGQLIKTIHYNNKGEIIKTEYYPRK